MKERFPGYYPPTPDELAQLWSQATISLDANVLLNLYRYSPETRDDLIGVLDQIKDRIWIPYQAGAEFHNNRAIVICEQMKRHSEVIEEMNNYADSFKKKIESTREHPFVSRGVAAKLSAAIDAVKTEIEALRSKYESLLTHDTILDRISGIIGANVGAELDGESHAAQEQEAERRIAALVPPGYMDKEKKSNRLGDAILWLQLIDYASKNKNHVILVTDDLKEDWWHLPVRGRRLGPRPELRQEFLRCTSCLFYMYEPGQFLKYAASELKTSVKSASIEEAREISQVARLGRSSSSDELTHMKIFMRSSAEKRLHMISHAVMIHRSALTRLVGYASLLSHDEWLRVQEDEYSESDIVSKIKRVATGRKGVRSTVRKICEWPRNELLYLVDELTTAHVIHPDIAALIHDIRTMPEPVFSIIFDD